MAVTRIAAHPLVVAVALGLLGPDALSSVAHRPLEPMRESRESTSVALDVAPVRDIDPEEFARVEREWHELRGLVKARSKAIF